MVTSGLQPAYKSATSAKGSSVDRGLLVNTSKWQPNIAKCSVFLSLKSTRGVPNSSSCQRNFSSRRCAFRSAGGRAEGCGVRSTPWDLRYFRSLISSSRRILKGVLKSSPHHGYASEEVWSAEGNLIRAVLFYFWAEISVDVFTFEYGPMRGGIVILWYYSIVVRRDAFCWEEGEYFSFSCCHDTVVPPLTFKKGQLRDIRIRIRIRADCCYRRPRRF